MLVLVVLVLGGGAGAIENDTAPFVGCIPPRACVRACVHLVDADGEAHVVVGHPLARVRVLVQLQAHVEDAARHLLVGTWDDDP